MHYTNYYWEKGLPVGQQKVEDPASAARSYKIVADPYKKHITIESYKHGIFDDLLYDSHILDFRRLNEQQQMGWQKNTLDSTPELVVALIRDLNDRVIFLEYHHFQSSLCTKCEVFSPHGWLASVHQMSYQSLGGDFNGVVLYDRGNRPVLKKIYEVNEDNEFTELLEETRDFSPD